MNNFRITMNFVA